MATDNRYQSTDRLADLIADNFMLLMVLSRFNIPLGFGDKSVGEVCKHNKVDCDTFLAVANFISGDNSSFDTNTLPSLSLPALVSYLKNAHSYFLEFNLPMMKRKLIDALDCSGENKVAALIIRYYDEMVAEVRSHMEYENTHVFAYVENLLQGKHNKHFSIAKFAGHHEQIDERVNELKNIIIKYYSGNGDNNLLNAVLYDIFSCEQDLVSHRQVEDCLFVPAVAQLEERMKK